MPPIGPWLWLFKVEVNAVLLKSEEITFWFRLGMLSLYSTFCYSALCYLKAYQIIYYVCCHSRDFPLFLVIYDGPCFLLQRITRSWCVWPWSGNSVLVCLCLWFMTLPGELEGGVEGLLEATCFFVASLWVMGHCCCFQKPWKDCANAALLYHIKVIIQNFCWKRASAGKVCASQCLLDWYCTSGRPYVHFVIC